MKLGFSYVPAIVSVTSFAFISSRVRSLANAEIAKSMFFFRSKRLIDRKFILYVSKMTS